MERLTKLVGRTENPRVDGSIPPLATNPDGSPCGGPFSRFLVARRRHARVREMLAQQLDVVLRAGRAVVRMVQEEFDAIEHDAEARAMAGFDGGAEMVEQGLDLPPVNVGAWRVGEDGVKQVGVLVAHGVRSGTGSRNMINLDRLGCLTVANRF